ncbi:hypothetical protein ERX27_07635 [Macrococcus brunensis]|uniref:Uncharacterized protein n=1 Tax=Macrococcus brunensis TaxID=198483 RepID=A0A4R6BD04_9STAP|nr:hypothetical protein [Macrococcus brunensis]TDL96718.1 hypothetical protein ERX27_07635 [Macrococcus brunensis]
MDKELKELGFKVLLSIIDGLPRSVWNEYVSRINEAYDRNADEVEVYKTDFFPANEKIGFTTKGRITK